MTTRIEAVNFSFYKPEEVVAMSKVQVTRRGALVRGIGVPTEAGLYDLRMGALDQFST